MSAQFLIALLIGLAASTEDLYRRRISNWIPITAFVSGISCLSFDRGWRGAASALGGAVGGFAIFLIFYYLGGLGGGDVKLMAGLGAVLGIEKVMPAALWTAAFGGVLAVLCVFASALKNALRRSPAKATAVRSIPYAPAIAIGSWLALISKG